CQALSLTLTNARPGGSISAFCDPVITTSIPHSSVLMSNTPRAVMASTTSIVSPYGFTISARALMLCATPVEVSLACTYTALIPESFFSASATAWGSTTPPHSTLISVTSAPNVLQSLVHRSPNFPPLMVRALSPGERKLDTEPSIPPVPEAASMSTLFFVWNSHLSPSRTSANTLSNSGARWWNMGRAMASSTSGGTGVGPGASKYRFNIDCSSYRIKHETSYYAGRWDDTIAPKSCQGEEPCRHACFQTVVVF